MSALLLGAEDHFGQRFLERLLVGLVEDDVDERVDDAEHPAEDVHRDVELGIVLSVRVWKYGQIWSHNLWGGGRARSNGR